MRFVLVGGLFGSTPVRVGLPEARAILKEAGDSRELQGWALRMVGTFLAIEGHVEEGRELLEQARTIFDELGNRLARSVLAFSTGPLELRAGNPVAAEREFREALDGMQELGELGRQVNLAAFLADALLRQDRIDEAEHYARVAREAAQEGDASGHAFWRIASALVLVRRGAQEEAVGLAREAIALMADTTEALTLPWLLQREAEVLQLAGHDAEAAAALRKAIAVASQKGALAEVALAEQQLRTIAAA